MALRKMCPANDIEVPKRERGAGWLLFRWNLTRITELSSGLADARDSSEAVEGVSG